MEKFVKYINDLFDVTKSNFYSWQGMGEKYDIKVNYLSYMGLIAAIPKRWKRS